jgi:ATP-dependent RNA helicase DDX3X
MNGLSLNDQGPPTVGGRSSYVPPHMRGKMGGGGNGPPGPSPAAMNGLNNSAWAG